MVKLKEKDGFKVGDYVRKFGTKCDPQKIMAIDGHALPFIMEGGGRELGRNFMLVTMPDKEKRIPFRTIFMELAFRLAERSTCSRRGVGCVVTSDDYSQVYGIGYNGTYKGGDNKCDRPNESGNCGCLHAEDNALLKTNVGPEIPKIVFVTTAPCVTCAKRIINKGGVKTVFYSEDHRCKEGRRILELSNINVIRIFKTDDGQYL